MTDMLQRVVASGTLAGASGSGSEFKQTNEKGESYTIPMAGKTGTTVNWADAWTVGFSPYYTTSIWFGFDMPGNSLGVEQTGATIAAPIWADFMRDIHKGLPFKSFPAAAEGVTSATVCAVSGQVPTEFCTDGTVTLRYLEGTQPVENCTVHKDKSRENNALLQKITGISDSLLQQANTTTTINSNLPTLDTTIKIDIPQF
jgi:penicillin-binding protein 1A